MFYLTYAPRPPINEFVDYFWLFEGGQTARKERIVPSGTIELVINLRDDEIRIYDREQPEKHRRFSGAVLSGTYSRIFVVDAMQHESMLGVHFKPGGAFPFLGALASELSDAHANLADLWGRPALELRERLCTVPARIRNGFMSWKRCLPAAWVALEKATLQFRLHCTFWDQREPVLRSEMSHVRLVYASGASAQCSLLKLVSLRSSSPVYCDFSGRGL